MSSLTREVLRKDSNLVELARLTNTMCNILKHYDHLTPALEEEYEVSVNSFCYLYFALQDTLNIARMETNSSKGRDFDLDSYGEGV